MMKFRIQITPRQREPVIIKATKLERIEDNFVFFLAQIDDRYIRDFRKFIKDGNVEIPYWRISRIEQLSPKEDTTTSSGLTE